MNEKPNPNLALDAQDISDAANKLADKITSIPESEDFELGKACDLSGEGTCEACQ